MQDNVMFICQAYHFEASLVGNWLNSQAFPFQLYCTMEMELLLASRLFVSPFAQSLFYAFFFNVRGFMSAVFF
jgi:hypothetical protein